MGTLNPGDIVETGSLAAQDYAIGVVVAVLGSQVSVKLDSGGFETFEASSLRKQERSKRLKHRYW